MDEQYATLAKLGVVFNVTGEAIGKRLTKLGIRNPKGGPSTRAFGQVCITRHLGIGHPGGCNRVAAFFTGKSADHTWAKNVGSPEGART
jgi:hypothetical protein